MIEHFSRVRNPIYFFATVATRTTNCDSARSVPSLGSGVWHETAQ